MGAEALQRFMANRAGAGGAAADELRRFEAGRVGYVMKQLGLGPKLVNELYAYREALTGVRELHLADFNAVYTGFPVYLGAHTLRCMAGPWPQPTAADYCVHRDRFSAEPSRFKGFAKVPFVVAYQDFFNGAFHEANGRPLGLVFPRRGFQQGMIIHNDESERFWHEGLCWVYKMPRTEHRLYVQPFSYFMDAVRASGVCRPD